MKRIYLPIEKFPVYNNAVDLYMVQSNILNGGAETVPGIHSVIWTKDNLEGHLVEIEGNKDGDYVRNGEYQRAAIPFIKNKIQEVEIKFSEYQVQRTKEGYLKPTEMPLQMLYEFYTFKARLTVLQAEADELRRRLQVEQDREQQEEDSKFLQYGLQGFTQFHVDPSLLGVIRQIDGQKVTQTEEGLLIINDPRSPYRGMSVIDYRALCKVFYNQQKQKESDELKRVQEQYKAEGKSIPVHLGVRAPRKVSRASLPPFPSSAKNYLAIDKIGRRRT